MRRKEIKSLSLKAIVLIIFVIFLLTIGVGYSYLKQTLKITGETTLTPQLVNGYIQGNSTYTLEILDVIENIEKNQKNYKIRLKIFNMDKDISSWKVSFDLPKSYNDEDTKLITDCYKICQNNRITLTALTDKFVAKGDYLIIEMQIALDLNENLVIENMVLNDLAVKNE